MKNILTFNLEDVETTENGNEKIDTKVELFVKKLIDDCKKKHAKFVDVDFGPNESDKHASRSLYGEGIPNPSGSKYPPPESLKWVRPIYEDDRFLHENDDDDNNDNTSNDEEEDKLSEEDDDDDEFKKFNDSNNNDVEAFCKFGKLFCDGVSSGDVIQGQLGDCWYLSALSVLASNNYSNNNNLSKTKNSQEGGSQNNLVNSLFWRLDKFKEFGLFVCRFFKDNLIIYVVIDDLLPVRRNNNKPVFGICKDVNELWVPLIEKAYAKLHGNYKSLIGGYTHYALGDLTGFAPHSLTLHSGSIGYNEEYSADEVYKILLNYKQWGSLMGCNIQAKNNQGGRAEAESGFGLLSGHAYSLLDVGEINISKEDFTKLTQKNNNEKNSENKSNSSNNNNNSSNNSSNYKIRLVKLRNPWGKGEWEGVFSDNSAERNKYDQEIKRVFNNNSFEEVTVGNDGTFFIPLQEWFDRFSNLFVAVKLPSGWRSNRFKGEWTGDSGGNRNMATWACNNPKIPLKLFGSDSSGKKEEFKRVFVGLYIKDSRMTMGADYYKDALYSTPLAFDIVTSKELSENSKQRDHIPHSFKMLTEDVSKLNNGNHVKQPAYNFGTTQVELYLKCGEDYLIIPSLYKRNQPGSYFITVYSECGCILGETKVENCEIKKKDETIAETKEESNIVADNSVKTTTSQIAEKKEQLREKLLSEMKRVGISLSNLMNLFNHNTTCNATELKAKLRDCGFSVADLPDLSTLDTSGHGIIELNYFQQFLSEGLAFESKMGKLVPPPPPVDDLLFKSTNLSGVLTANVFSAKALIFDSCDNKEIQTRKILDYDEIKQGKLKPSASINNNNSSNNKGITRTIQDTFKLSSGVSRDILKDFEALSLLNINSSNVWLYKKVEPTVAVRKPNVNLNVSNHNLNQVSNTPAKNAKGNNNMFGMISSGVKSIFGSKTVTPPSPLKEKKSPKLSVDQENSLSPHVDKINFFNARKESKQMSFHHNNSMFTSFIENGFNSFTSMFSHKVENGEFPVIPFPDLWDILVDRVVTISESKSLVVSQNLTSSSNVSRLYYVSIFSDCIKKKKLGSSDLNINKNIQSDSLEKTKIRNVSNLKGNAATGKNLRHKKNNSEIEKKEIILNETTYDEVYRRLINIPIQNVGNDFGNEKNILRRFYKNLDLNRDGQIIIEEFVEYIRKSHIDINDENIMSLKNRFESDSVPGKLDWIEFSSFFTQQVSRSVNNMEKLVTPDLRPLDILISQIKEIVIKASQTSQTVAQNNNKGKPEKTLLTIKTEQNIIIDVPCIFQTMLNSDIITNSKILRKMGMNITEKEMSRVSRVFNYSTDEFMHYVQSQDPLSSNITQAICDIDSVISQALLNRVSSSIINSNLTTVPTVLNNNQIKTSSSSVEVSYDCVEKVWSSFAPSKASLVPFEKVTSFLFGLVEDHFYHLDAHLTVHEESKNNKDENSPLDMNIHLLCRLVTDSMIESLWNKTLLMSTTISSNLSLSGFDAYVRLLQTEELEAKLKCLALVENTKAEETTNMLAHVYVSSARDELLVLLSDPIVGETYSLSLKEPVTLPSGSKLAELFPRHKENMSFVSRLPEDLRARCYDPESILLFNPHDTPSEDTAITSLLSQLRLVRNGIGAIEPCKLVLTEKSEIINDLRHVLENSSHDLPFFYTLDERILTFEVSDDYVPKSTATKSKKFNPVVPKSKSSDSLPFLVFGEIRKCKSLFTHITKIQSSVLSVKLSFHSSKESLTLSWLDMLNHLLELRNPFLTLELLPDFIDIDEYIFDPQNFNNTIKSSTNLKIQSDKDKNKEKCLQQGNVIVDGGSYPTFNSNFTFNFTPPKLLDCKVLSTEISKMNINGCYKYGVVMVREAAYKNKNKTTDQKLSINNILSNANSTINHTLNSVNNTFCNIFSTTTNALQNVIGHSSTIKENNSVSKEKKETVDINENDDEAEIVVIKKPKEVKSEVDSQETTSTSSTSIKLGTTFRFLTFYDPLSATEYLCGVKNTDPLAPLLYSQSPEKVNCDLSEFLNLLEVASDNEALIVGPAITPRLIISVYNSTSSTSVNGNVGQEIGHAEVSVSSVFSGLGHIDKKWVTLKKQNQSLSNSTSISSFSEYVAGEVEIELNFRKNQEIKAEVDSINERKTKALTLKTILSEPKKENNVKNKVQVSEVSKEKNPKVSTDIINDNKSETKVEEKKVDPELQTKLEELKKENEKLKELHQEKEKHIQSKEEIIKKLQAESKVTNYQKNNNEDDINDETNNDEDNGERKSKITNKIKARETEELLKLKEELERTKILTEKLANDHHTLKKEKDALQKHIVVLTKQQQEELRQQKVQQEKLLEEKESDKKSASVDISGLVSLKDYESLHQQYNALLGEADRLRKSFNTTVNSVVSVPTPLENKNTNAISNTVTSGGGMNENSSLSGINGDIFVRKLAQLLVSRYKARFKRIHTNSAQPIEALVRVLKTYSRSVDGRITRSDLHDALQDISVETTPEQISILTHQMPCSDEGDGINIQAFIEFMKAQINSLSSSGNKKQREKPQTSGQNGEIDNANDFDLNNNRITGTSMRPQSAGKKRKPIEKERLNQTTPAVANLAQSVDLSASLPTKTPISLNNTKIAMKEKPKKQDKPKQDNVQPPVITPTISVSSKIKNQNSVSPKNKANNNEDENYEDENFNDENFNDDKEGDPNVDDEEINESNDEDIQDYDRNNQRKDSSMDIKSKIKVGDIDWSLVPLPHNWEKRVDVQSGKTYYVDHSSRATQWKHPLNTGDKK